ncbi:putative ABC transporter ATP-binding protein YbhF [bacterium BMS3Abin07]|nr:putative ABC transporter ATP-binding protein YbhF [bacterium BMS3Abin07]
MIEVINCTKKYGELTAVNNLSLRIPGAKIFGFLGPNGAGKSTTIKMMVGLINPDSGQIKIEGHDIAADSINAKKMLAYVPEEGFIFEKMTAWEYLRFISGLYSLEQDSFRENAERYLEAFRLREWKNEIIGNFSHGMKQRLLLTSALMRDPKALILDEPHNGLDPKGIKILRDIIFGLRDKGMTIILCTHIIAIAEQMCDSVAIISRGSIVAQGTKDDLKHYADSEDKTLEDIFLRLTSGYER